MIWLEKDKIWFPNPYFAPKDYPLAIGGDLSPERLLFAYSNGIFPWYHESEPILWWSPDPRMVLYPEKIKISNSLKKIIRNKGFKVEFDRNFKKVIDYCSKVERKGQKGTWITNEMKEAYLLLHKLGYAHSVEVYLDDEIVGGLYGVAIGGIFFGESMFHLVPNASKVALVKLGNFLKKMNFDIIDCQQSTPHLARMGAFEISRKKFLDILKISIRRQTILGKWKCFDI